MATEPVRRMEVFTGAGRRRSWTADEKAGIVAESFGDGDTVCGVARRHGLTPQQLFSWRRQARRPLDEGAETASPLFVPAVVEARPMEQVAEGSRLRDKDSRRVRRASAIIEVEIGGVTVRVGRGAEAKTVAAVIRALKAGS